MKKAYDAPGMHLTRLLRQSPGFRAIGVRVGVVALLVVSYRLLFPVLHERIGNPTFLMGLIPCLTGAALLGIRGALGAVVVVFAIDRGFAMNIQGPELGIRAGVIALLVKLVLAGGLGLVVDGRRRVERLNAQLQQEVDARKRSELLLARSDALHRALVDSLGEGVGLFDANDRVVFANQALSDTLQSSLDGLLGRPFSDFLVKASCEQLVVSGSNSGESKAYEVVLQSDASTVLLVTETMFMADGAAEAMTLRVVRDLTDRIVSERRQRDLERELQRSQSLQSLAVMAGGVAHDFNNLLCGVVGNAEVAQRKLPASAPAALSQCLAEIVTFADEAAQLSKQMLAYAGQRSLGIEALDVNVELSSALRLLHATVESRARLVLDLGDELPEVAADRFQLRQVVTNLVLNALDAMEGARGVLTVRSELLQLDANQAQRYEVGTGDYVKLTVADTGSGIQPYARERLFEPFFSTKAAGRGMGLAAASGIVRAHRGWLGVDGTSDRGTRFGVLLPLARLTTPRRTAAAPCSHSPPVPRNILLIDDEPAVRVVTAKLLRELGQHVTTADSGRRALELLEEEPEAIDLVVLDLTMPELSGEQVLDELRNVREDVPVVISSGFQATDATKLLAVPNVVGFLDKPHTLTGLETLLASIEPGRGKAPVSRRHGPVSVGRRG